MCPVSMGKARREASYKVGREVLVSCSGEDGIVLLVVSTTTTARAGKRNLFLLTTRMAE